MLLDIIGAVVAATVGFLIAFINYIFSKKVILKTPEKYFVTSVVRQALQIGFLVVVYFVGSKIQSVDIIYLLVGAVVGMTIPMFFFTKKILALNESLKQRKTEKEDEANG